MNKRKRKYSTRGQLGITARQGPRTGYPELDWGTPEKIADAFLDTFSDFCVDAGMIKPPFTDAIVAGGKAMIEDSATGQPVFVDVYMQPSDQAFSDVSLPVTGVFKPSQDLILIHPQRGACKNPNTWRNILISAIRHEMTHAADPGVYQSRRKGLLWERKYREWREGQGPEPSLLELPRNMRARAKHLIEATKRGVSPKPIQEQPQKEFCEYVNTREEVSAFTAQVGSELTIMGRRLIAANDKGFSSPTKALRAMSPTYREIEECLLPKAKKKFLHLAARAWARGEIPRLK